MGSHSYRITILATSTNINHSPATGIGSTPNANVGNRSGRIYRQQDSDTELHLLGTELYSAVSFSPAHTQGNQSRSSQIAVLDTKQRDRLANEIQSSLFASPSKHSSVIFTCSIFEAILYSVIHTCLDYLNIHTLGYMHFQSQREGFYCL